MADSPANDNIRTVANTKAQPLWAGLLTPDTGHPHLDKQIIEVVTLMRVSENKDSFNQLFARAFPKRPKKDQNQMTLFQEPAH